MKEVQISVGNRAQDKLRGTICENQAALKQWDAVLENCVRNGSVAVVRGRRAVRAADLQKYFPVNVYNKSKTVDSLQIIYKYLAPDLGLRDGQPGSECCGNAEYYSGNIYRI